MTQQLTSGADTADRPTGGPAERLAMGRAAREAAPLKSHAELPLNGARPDPVSVLADQGATRLPDLVPVRYGRMLTSPFAHFRGAAAVMAADLAGTPSSGLTCQICGDAHLSNFGLFASPERRLVFDVNDFDETYPGPWEWDVKRLAASLVIAARENGLRRKERAAAVRGAVGRYRKAMHMFAQLRDLEVWYTHIDVDELDTLVKAPLSKSKRDRLAETTAKARTHDSLQAHRKLTTLVNGRRRIVADPPLIVPISDVLRDADRHTIETWAADMLAGYASTLDIPWRRLIGGFQFVDMARKAVGVGSVGTRCWVVLLNGRDENDPLLLQIKEAPPSVIAGHVRGRPRAGYGSEGERVVAGQRLMQAFSDIFLGWQSAEGDDGRVRDFYVRQLRDWKGSATIEVMDAEGLRLYGALCGWTLARAHARTGDRIAISGYLGNDPTFDKALVHFAERYADRNEQDYQLLQQAARSGRIPVRTGL